jgi:hypothetical protein
MDGDRSGILEYFGVPIHTQHHARVNLSLIPLTPSPVCCGAVSYF